MQSNLGALKIEDPFGIKNSEAVVTYLKEENPGQCHFLSIDIEDLYYSVLHSKLMRCVQSCITEDNDESAFIERCGISLEAFLELLSFYLKSTVIGHDNQFFVQRAGVCIGSRVAPALSSMFLGCVDA